MKNYPELQRYAFIASTFDYPEKCKKCCFHPDSHECFEANCQNGYIIDILESDKENGN